MRSRLLLAVLLLASVCFGQDAFRMPGTKPGRCLTAYLVAFNTGQPNPLRQFFLDNYSSDALTEIPVDQRLPQHLAVFRETGGFDAREIVASSEDMVAILAQSKVAEDWWQLECHLDKHHNVLGIALKPADRPADQVFRGKLSAEQLGIAVDSYAEKLHKAGLFDGVVLIEKDNQMVLRTVYGARNGQPHQLDDVYPLASMSKMFTAVAIVQLASEKKLDYSDLLSKYLKDQPRAITDRVTIQQCLTHTAGFLSLLEPQWFAGTNDWHQVVTKLMQRPLQYPQGEFHYSNADFLLLDEVVERISGEPLEKYLQEHVWEPARMTATNLGSTTAPDLLNFAFALRTNALLSKKAEEEMLEPKVNTETPGLDYAYGFFVHHYPNETIVGHGGGAEHFGGELDMYMVSGYDVVILSDSASPLAAQRVTRRVRDLITARP
jgi:CubicO group peptidase (beta-lactamase class C family)